MHGFLCCCDLTHGHCQGIQLCLHLWLSLTSSLQVVFLWVIRVSMFHCYVIIFFFFSQCFMISFSLFLSLYVNSSFVFCFLTGFVSLYSSFSCYANLMGCSWKTSFCSSFSFAFLNNFLLCFYSEEREKSEKQRKLLCFLTNWKHLFLLRRILRK